MNSPTRNLLLGCPKPVRLPRVALIWAVLMASLAACDGPISAPAGGGSESPLTCEIDFRLEEEGRFKDVYLHVFHDSSLGTFGEVPECESPRLPPHSDLLARTCYPLENCDEATSQLLLNLAHSSLGLDRGFSGPRVIARCAFHAERVPSAEDFELDGARTIDLDMNWNDASVQVSSVTCVGAGSSTSTSLTTSTSLPQCENAQCSTGKVCVQNVCVDPDLYAIDFSLNEPVFLGALQFLVEPDDGLYGSFVWLDGRDAPWCEIDFDPSVFAAGAVRDDGLRLGFISPVGFTCPTKLATCFFEGATSPLSPEDFLITVEDASAPDTNAIEPFPTVSISDVRQIIP